MSRPSVYLDNGATTKTDPRVAAVAIEVMTEVYGNPSSMHAMGQSAKARVAHARAQVARAIGASAEEITFTSGGTESNALGVLGAARADLGRSHHVVVSGLEHSSVSQACSRLHDHGYVVTWVKPGADGIIDADEFIRAIRPNTAVATIIWVQNEIGTIQPIEKIAAGVRAIAPKCHIHIDGVQAVGKVPINVHALQIDSLSLSGHKLHGPKGIGALYLRKAAVLAPLTFGGGQEKGLRSGTENVPGIVALGLAVELAESTREISTQRMQELGNSLVAQIRARAPRVVRHGENSLRAPHIVSLGFPEVITEMLFVALADRGVYVSTGSACRAADMTPSPIMQALGVPDHMATLRFSLCRDTTPEEIKFAADTVIDTLVYLGAPDVKPR